MPIDFKASQIRTNKIIASGSDTKPYLLMYPSSSAIDQVGGISNISNTGSDGWLFISGSINGNDKVVFGGDASISGSFVVEPRLSDSLIYASVNSNPILSRVGIKNNSPETTLHIGGTSDPGLLVDTGAIINYGRNNSSSATFLVQSKLGGDHGLLVVSGCCDRVSIGKHNPNAKLDVYGDGIYSGSLTVTGSLVARSITGSIQYVNTSLTTPFFIGDGVTYSQSTGQWSISGDAYTRSLQTPTWRGVTSGSGQVEIFLDGVSKRYTIPMNSAQSYIILASARQIGGTTGFVGDSRWFRIEGAIKDVNHIINSIGLNSTYDDGDVGTSSWDISIVADGLNDALVVKVTGENNKEIDWSITAYPANNIARALTLDGQFNWYGSTSDATAKEIFLDGISKRFPIKYDGNHTFSLICNGLSSTGDSRWFKIDGGIKNVAGVTSLIGSTTIYDDGDSGASTWDINAEADDINDSLKIIVTGSAATDIDWIVTGYISDAEAQTVNFPNDTIVWQGVTTGSGYVELFTGGLSKRLTIPEDRTLAYQIIAHGFQTGGGAGTTGDSHWYRINGAVKNVTGSVNILGANYIYDDADPAAATWDILVDGDDSSDSLRVRVLGESNKKIEWFVKGYITDVTSIVGVGCGRPSGRGSQIQFNDGGIFGSDELLTWNKYTSTLTAINITGSLTKLVDGTDYIIAGSNVLITTGANGSITISTSAGAGDVYGPASATDGAIALYDGTTGKIIKNSDLLVGQGTATQNYVTMSVNTALTNYGLALTPNGQGPLSANVPDATTLGGNARGTNAIDFQMVRNAATKVASGQSSVIVGGENNTSNNTLCVVVGGEENQAIGEYCFIGGGAFNSAGSSGDYSTVVGGEFNSANNGWSTVGGGYLNTAAGLNSTIPGGEGNTAQSYGETVLGLWATIGAGSQSTYVSTDRLFVVGNGIDNANRSNALTLIKNGDLHLSGTLTLMSGSTDQFTLPTTAGLNGQVLTSDGAGLIVWQAINEYFYSTTLDSIYTTGSTAFVGFELGIDSPSDKGSDVFFYVSGSTDDSANALFGGGLVVSGNLRVDGNTIVGDSSADTFVLSASLDSNIIPTLDSTYTLGTPTNRFAHVYTGDLHLRNDRGDWTILEERDYLCVINNITGKKYKMSLIPLNDE